MGRQERSNLMHRPRLSGNASLRGLRGAIGMGFGLLLGSCQTPNATRVITASQERQASEARTQMEVRTGHCSGEHERELHAALEKLTEAFGLRGERAGFKLVGSQVL